MERRGSFGARAQARIELADLIRGSNGRRSLAERRKLPRLEPGPRGPRPADTAQASARAGRLGDFVSVALVASVFAVLAATQTYAVLAARWTLRGTPCDRLSHHQMLGINSYARRGEPVNRRRAQAARQRAFRRMCSWARAAAGSNV